VALALGHQQVYPHYFIPLFPLPFLALAYLLAPLWRHRLTAPLAVAVVAGLALWNTHAVWENGFGLARAALLDPADVQTPNLTLGTLRDVTRTIAAQAITPARAAAPYNFELLSPSDYPTDYKYLLRLEGAPPNHAPVARKVVVVQPAYLPPAAWPSWVTAGLAGARPRFWLFHHVALWAWGGRSIATRGGPPPARGAPAPGAEDAARLVTALALGHGAQVWRGSPAGIALSRDGGRTWGAPASTRGPGVPDQPAALLADPARRDRAYAATATGLYATADGGAHWSAVAACPGRAFALAAPSAALRLAGGEHGLCVSRDGGRTWTQQVLVTSATTAEWERAHPQPVYAFWQQPAIAALAIKPARAAIARADVLAGAGYGLISSSDGVHWHRLPDMGLGVTALAVLPAIAALAGLIARAEHGSHVAEGSANGTLYAGTASGMWRSTTGGRTWEHLLTGMSTPYVFGCLVQRAGPRQVVWAATAAGLFRLEQGSPEPQQNGRFPRGAWKTPRWSLIDGGWPADAAALSVAGAGTRLYVGTDSGLYRSNDGGATWMPS
jgi:photosystem II stability/assembly factor-like uncharacterized protein